jgi:hypothetical protein
MAVFFKSLCISICNMPTHSTYASPVSGVLEHRGMLHSSVVVCHTRSAHVIGMWFTFDRLCANHAVSLAHMRHAWCTTITHISRFHIAYSHKGSKHRVLHNTCSLHAPAQAHQKAGFHVQTTAPPLPASCPDVCMQCP